MQFVMLSDKEINNRNHHLQQPIDDVMILMQSIAVTYINDTNKAVINSMMIGIICQIDLLVIANALNKLALMTLFIAPFKRQVDSV